MQEDKRDENGFASYKPAATVEPTPSPVNTQNTAIMSQLSQINVKIKHSGGWFYTIAGLSVINTLIAAFHGTMSFIFGLGITSFIDAVVQHFGTKLLIIGLPVNLFIAGMYVFFGYFAGNKAKWAFITGIVFYVLDMLLCVLIQYWMGVLFHAFALVGICKGFKLISEAEKLELQMRKEAAGY